MDTVVASDKNHWKAINTMRNTICKDCNGEGRIITGTILTTQPISYTTCSKCHGTGMNQ